MSVLIFRPLTADLNNEMNVERETVIRKRGGGKEGWQQTVWQQAIDT